MFLLFFMLLLNFVISYWNATVVGRFWSEKDDLPTWTRVIMWSGAIMAVSGFFVVYVSLLTMIMKDLHMFEWLATAFFKITLEPAEIEMLVQNIFDLAYLVIIFPVLGTGLMITINSWIVAYARRDLLSVGVAGYNTFAQLNNTIRAVRYVPQATRSLGKSFKLKLGKDSGKAVAYIALFLFPIVVSLGGAIATTAVIMRASDARYQLDDIARESLEA